MRDRLLEAVDQARGEAHEHWSAQQQRFGGSDSAEEFDQLWQQPGGATSLVSAPLVLARLNEWLAADGYRELTAETAARSVKLNDVPVDVITALLAVDEL